MEGRVTAVDAARKLITRDHDAILNVPTPAMTMMFVVPDAAMLNGLRQGEGSASPPTS